MKKAVAYARTSTNVQMKESIDAQFRAIEDYCKRNNILLMEKYKDEGISGITDDRPAFQEMIKASEDGLFDYVIVLKPDRFTRTMHDETVYIRQLKENNVQVLSVYEDIDNKPENPIIGALFEKLQELDEED